MGTFDLLVLSNVGISFLGYLFFHFGFFRFSSSQWILKMLVVNYFIGALMSVAITCWAWPHADLLTLISTVKFELVCLALYTLICFVYVLCVFGPYESSIRLRLLRELHAGGAKGKTWEEILKNYSTEKILRIRIDRFLGSGEVIQEGEILKAGQHKYIFLLLENIAQFLQKIIGIKRE